MSAALLYGNGFSCSGLTQTTGLNIVLSDTDLDKATVVWKCPPTRGRDHKPRLGDKFPCENLYCTNVNVQEGGDFDTVNATYEGFINNPKIPKGGATNATKDMPIQAHPNYTNRKGTWGIVFGEGNASPNEFGRYLDEDGLFKMFGPLPDGKEGSPEPFIKDTDCVKKVNDLCRLCGVEGFLDTDSVAYKYSIISEKNWAADLAKKVTQRVYPISDLIPVPELQPNEDRDWLLISVDIDSKHLTGNRFAYTTSVEFRGSGPGGWNALIYQDGGVANLDSMSKARSAF